MAKQWGIPPPVLDWGLEYGGWSHYYHLASDLQALEAECTAQRNRPRTRSSRHRPPGV